MNVAKRQSKKLLIKRSHWRSAENELGCYASRYERGLSLLELLIVLLIISIVALIAIPLSANLIKSYEVSATTNDLLATLQFARQEAIKRASSITVCPRAEVTSADSTLTCGQGSDWSQGWLVLMTNNDSSSADLSDTGCESYPCVLRAWPAVRGGHTVFSSRSTALRFNSRGMAPGHNRTYRLCSRDGFRARETRQIVLSTAGRVINRESTDGECS